MATDNRVLRREANEIFVFEDFITAVPAGATQAADLALPEGLYRIYVIGTQTAATTAPTFGLETYVDSAKSQLVTLFGYLHDDTAGTAAVALDVAKTILSLLFLSHATMAVGIVSQPTYVGKGGLKYTYTKNGGTAVRLTLIAVRSN